MENDKDLKLNPPFFLGYIYPNGHFDSTREVHALWNYYLCARNAYESIIKDAIVLEGDKDPEANLQELFKNMARLYGVTPEEMGKCWHMVDRQCDELDIPRMPDEDRYRFVSRVIILNS